jgi:hypothetical protein
MLKHGRWPFALVGGSDVHDHAEVICSGVGCDPTNAELAGPTTTVWADTFVWANGKTGVMDGIAAGRAVIHDASNFIDLRVTYRGREYMVGDTIDDYEPGSPLGLRAIGLAPIIGDSVSATTPETITAAARVNANSRNRDPVNPPWMPTGA